MTMTDEAAFLGTIIKTPCDDAPRLVFADWLEENGDPERAEFIRVQCELAGWPSNDSNVAKHAALRRRERELFRNSGPKWWYHLPGSWRSTGDDMRILTAEGCAYTVRRGFVASVEAGFETLFVGGDCPRCLGDGRWVVVHDGDSAAEIVTCPECGSQRQAPCLASMLGRSAPIEEVRVTGIRPFFDGRNYLWFRRYPEWRPGQGDVQMQLFDLMPPDDEGHHGMRAYETHDAAMEALGKAALARLRQLAAGNYP